MKEKKKERSKYKHTQITSSKNTARQITRSVCTFDWFAAAMWVNECVGLKCVRDRSRTRRTALWYCIIERCLVIICLKICRCCCGGSCCCWVPSYLTCPAVVSNSWYYFTAFETWRYIHIFNSAIHTVSTAAFECLIRSLNALHVFTLASDSHTLYIIIEMIIF